MAFVTTHYPNIVVSEMDTWRVEPKKRPSVRDLGKVVKHEGQRQLPHGHVGRRS